MIYDRYAYKIREDGTWTATLVRQDESNDAFVSRVSRPGLSIVWERPAEIVRKERSASFPGVRKFRRAKTW